MALDGTTDPFGKDIWLAGAYDQLEQTPGLFFNLVDQAEPERIDGRNTYFKVVIGDSLGDASIGSGGDFPAPVDPEYAEATVTMDRNAHTIGLTFDEWEKLNREPTAAVPIVAEKMKRGVQKMTRELARKTLMDGTAKLARCAVTSASLTVNLQSSDGSSGSANQYDRDRWNWLVARRARIDIVSASTGAAITNGSNRTIVSVSKSGNTIVLDTAGGVVTTATTDVITWAGSVDAFSSGTYTSGEFEGLGAMMSTSRTYLGINSATAGNEYWDPITVNGATSGTNEPITTGRFLRLVQELADTAEDGMEPTSERGYCLFSNFGVCNHALQQLQSHVRYIDPKTGDKPDITGGWRKVDGFGIEWYADVHYSHNVLDMLHKPSIKFVRPKEPMNDILDFVTLGNGSIWHLANASSGQGHAAAVRAYLTGLFGLMTYRPNVHGRLDDIVELS